MIFHNKQHWATGLLQSNLCRLQEGKWLLYQCRDVSFPQSYKNEMLRNNRIFGQNVIKRRICHYFIKLERGVHLNDCAWDCICYKISNRGFVGEQNLKQRIPDNSRYPTNCYIYCEHLRRQPVDFLIFDPSCRFHAIVITNVKYTYIDSKT